MNKEAKKTSEEEKTKKVISDRALQLSETQAPDYGKGSEERMALAKKWNKDRHTLPVTFKRN